MDLTKPKSGALVSLFSPSLYWMKTVIKLFSTGCRRVSSVDWKTSSGGGEVGRWGRIDEVWNLGTMFSQQHAIVVDWGVYTCSELGESVKQYARIVWASLISSLQVYRYDCLPHRFSPTFQPPLFSVENLKNSNFRLVFETVSFFKTFLFWLFLFHVSLFSSGWRYTTSFWDFFCYLIR